ncbi:MAG: hypothetical protein NZ853_06740 [Leptospiraceae bacterium]|nr:hypothetical protein [Leptospiraceae bacterium]MDW7975870.1 hypothetical protein [Leptospiraceae bacterium]
MEIEKRYNLKEIEEKYKSIQPKKPEIELPSYVFLTPIGLKFLSTTANPLIVIRRYQNINGYTKEGFVTKSFNAQVMQKMIMKFYVDEIYSAQPELLPLRNEIISTNNLIVYAILYRKLTPTLAKSLFESKVVKEFNRKHPKESMTELNHISEQKVELLYKKYGHLLEGIKARIREEITQKILENHQLNEEDQFTRIRALPKFIDWIDKRVWFLFFIIYQTEFRDRMLQNFQSLIYHYLEHTVIATHLSNLIMEFVQNAEKAHFLLLANKYFGIPINKADSFIRNRENRLKLRNIALEKKQNLEISWILNPERLISFSLSRLQIVISNYGLIDEATTQKLRKKMKTDVEGISIASFYEDIDDAEKLGAGLGLLYNSYLEQICRKEGIQYKCVIYPEPKTQKTTVKIDLVL